MWYVRVLCVHVSSGNTSSALPLIEPRAMEPRAADVTLGLLDLAQYFFPLKTHSENCDNSLFGRDEQE